MHRLPPHEVMDAAFRSRDKSYNGAFFAAVTTTGIFCQPSCPARKPDPRNVVFYATAAEALFAGYRPCKRCSPLEGTEDPEWLASLISRVEENPTTRIRDSELRNIGLEPATVRRRFQARYGLTFQAFQRARRLAAAFESIKSGGSIDDAVFDSGYESHSGFRDAFSRLFGDAPGRASRGADLVRLAWVETQLGPMLAGATDLGICFLEFSDRRMLEAQAASLTRRLRLPVAPAPHPLLEALSLQLGEYFAGARRVFE
ncbi:MAG: Ada metal-binding domain-containing protein, partial [Spirochaetaceae bacterium]|nr:Ada metal-binding domain-containing protein [Spirochaetaceae bacterium]